MKTDQPLFDLPWPAKGALLCFSPDGKTLAVAHGWLNRWSSTDAPAAFTLWDVNSGEFRHTLQTDEKQVRFLAWSADNKRCSVASTEGTKELSRKCVGHNDEWH